LTLRKRLEKRFNDVDLYEFRALVKNLVPATEQQAEWICNEAERILHEHPELLEKLETWEEDSEEELEEARRIITSILNQRCSEQGPSEEKKVIRKRVKKR